MGETEAYSKERSPSAEEGIKVTEYRDPDEAINAFEGLDSPLVLDEATNKRLLRKIDMMLMPMLCIVYCLNFLDKTALSYASVMGLSKELGLKGDQYSWLGSIFYFGYLLWEYPAARLLQRLPLAKYSAFCIVAWGVVLCCFAAAKTVADAAILRFFLGALEASVSPGFALFTSQWYTKREQSARLAYWASGTGFSQIFGGVVAYGISHTSVSSHFTIAPWKIVFLFAGVLTVVVGFVFLAIMPDSQLNAWWLSEEDRRLAVERIRGNQQGIGNKHFKMSQLKEALTDPITWAFVFFAVVSDIPNGGLSNFFSLLIVSFGFTPEQSLLYGTPAGGIQLVALISWGFITQRYGHRLYLAAGAMATGMIGAIVLVTLPAGNNGGRLAGYYLSGLVPLGFLSLFSLISTNVAGYTKKTTVAALYFIGYCIGNIIGPQTFQSKDAPRYIPAVITLIVCWGVCVLDLLLIRWLYQRQNKKKALQRADPSYLKQKDQEWLDMTDLENPEFVYEL